MKRNLTLEEGEANDELNTGYKLNEQICGTLRKISEGAERCASTLVMLVQIMFMPFGAYTCLLYRKLQKNYRKYLQML